MRTALKMFLDGLLFVVEVVCIYTYRFALYCLGLDQDGNRRK